MDWVTIPPEEAPEWPEPNDPEPKHTQPAMFNENENIRDRYSESELESFMKILNVKPFGGWNDTALYHHSTGLHFYDDIG